MAVKCSRQVSSSLKYSRNSDNVLKANAFFILASAYPKYIGLSSCKTIILFDSIMAHYYCFSVHPKDSHPMRAKIQAGWAYVFVWDEAENSEEMARIGVEALGFHIQHLQDARMLTPESFQL